MYGVKALQRALEGVNGETALHICFGYAAIIHDGRPNGYHFLGELADTDINQVSVETAQSDLNPQELVPLKQKKVILGVLDLSDPEVETPETVATRIRRGLETVPAEKVIVAPDCGLKYLPHKTAFGKMKAMVEGAKIVREELR